ncbi:MAG: [Oscillospiraceae bacterium]|nr:2Fe-2S iron-sulfur cluster binding domain-containing protein [Oscillospiraceae bacterium]MBR6610610.1 [FeFe] hydrogenase, group A [Oscillospiraceae bacterium]
MDMVKVKINGIEVEVPAGSTILEAAYKAGIDIPTLCYLKDINEIGACRICVVEVKGMRGMVTACVYPVADGMEVFTNTEKVQKARKMNLELVLSTHNQDCLGCVRSGDCELQKLAKDYGIKDTGKWSGMNMEWPVDDSAAHMYRDNSKCILCRRCVAACGVTQGIGVIGANERGFETHIASAFEQPLDNTSCVSCGQCIVVCPTGAIAEKDDTDKVWAALADPTKHVVVQTAPSIRATLGECFNMPIGTNVQGKMVAAARRLGFDKVFDTDFAADLTIMEEATEFLHRFTSEGSAMPLITSCSPGWVKYCETYFPEFIPNLSSCKSPQQMFGAVAKTYYAQKMGLDPKDIVVVAVMPCVAKKFEVGRPDQSAAGVPDVDVAITTREFARMIEKAGIKFDRLPDEEFDRVMGEASGAGHIFGASGGVMEAALRTAAEVLTGKELDKPEFMEVRGTDKGIKEAVYTLAGKTIRVAAVSGLANAKEILTKVKNGEAQYDFIEVMACPGGCINGGGQPTQPASVRNFVDLKSLRANALYSQDEKMTLRKSHMNQEVQTLYKEFLGEPGSHKAHEILHTSYVARPIKY